ncbi:MAG: DUF3443 family protein [Bdellovibrionia bacterium]
MYKMNPVALLALFGSFLSASGCSGVVVGRSSMLMVCGDATSKSTTSTISPSGSNVMSVTVGSGSLCGTRLNYPCTTVTICPLGSTTGCQTISDILVDTGSFGLRIFAQALNPNVCKTLSPLTDSLGNAVGECAMFGSLNAWGSVMMANVQLGGEAPVKTPVQLIDKAFATVPTSCGQVATTPQSVGFNGILGVGLRPNDCGSACETTTDNNMYYSCVSAGTCKGTLVSIDNQVTNPVTLLPTDNNGVLLDLPSVGANGSSSVTGSLYLGIGTQSNNTPASETAYSANSQDEFQTAAFSQTYGNSFIDTGSNTLSFPTNSGLSTCSSSSGLASFYCPSGAPVSLTATTTGLPSGLSGSVSYSVGNAVGFSSSNYVFNNLASVISFGLGNTSFIWGLPFFLGRRVFVVIRGKSSPFGIGPYWAY